MTWMNDWSIKECTNQLVDGYEWRSEMAAKCSPTLCIDLWRTRGKQDRYSNSDTIITKLLGLQDDLFFCTIRPGGRGESKNKAVSHFPSSYLCHKPLRWESLYAVFTKELCTIYCHFGNKWHKKLRHKCPKSSLVFFLYLNITARRQWCVNFWACGNRKCFPLYFTERKRCFLCKFCDFYRTYWKKCRNNTYLLNRKECTNVFRVFQKWVFVSQKSQFFDTGTWKLHFFIFYIFL